MGGSRRTIGLSIAVAVAMSMVALCGCASAPASASRAAAQSAITQSGVAQTTALSPGIGRPGTSATPQGQALAPGGTAGFPAASTSDPQAMHDIIAEIQELGTLDPAARDELLYNLKQTDPSLWPLVAQQVQASLAWRRQAAQREIGGPVADGSREAQPLGPTPPPSQTAAYAPSRPTVSQEPSPGSQPPSPGSFQRAPAFPAYAGRSPQTGDAVPRSPEATQRNSQPSQDTPRPSESPAQPSPADHQAARAPEHRDAPASQEPESPRDCRSHLREAIQSLESDVARAPQSDRELAEHARLRMLYLLDGQRDEALRPIPSIAPAMQEFWSEQFYGLATLMECELISESSRRKAEAKQHLDAAAGKLGESCPLAVRNLAFVTDIQSYGTYKPFDKYEFVPGQTVLLYAEVENFKSAETAKGFHTATRSSYQLFDSSGKRVAEHEFSPSEEYCRQPRRDFFIGYEFCLPRQIYPGKHVLQLTVADLNSQKIGQSLIEFTIKSTDD